MRSLGKHMRVLLVNTNSKQCGIYQFGYNIGKVLTNFTSNTNEYFYEEPGNLEDFQLALNRTKADIVVINYVPGLMSYVHNHVPCPAKIYINIIHEPGQFQHLKSSCNPYYFSHGFYANTTLKEEPGFFPLPRLIPPLNAVEYVNKDVPKIGAFGFGFLSRGWLQTIDRVQDEFDTADICFHMPFNSVVDLDGKTHALNTEKLCNEKTLKPGITLKITHDFLSTSQVVEWLGQNTVNLFLYQEKNKIGISSSVDFALSARRPIGISSSPMFDHLLDVKHLICLDSNKIQDIIDRGPSVLEPYLLKWKESEFFLKFENLIGRVK